MTKIIVEVFSWIKTIGLALIIAIIINTFVLQTYQVKGESMVPTFAEGDKLFILKVDTSYSYGDIVVIDSRVDHKRSYKDEILDHALVQKLKGIEIEYLWIKRVIGLPNDRIKFEDGVLYRNGEKVEENYINEEMLPSDTQEWTVPADHIFVLGDNRNKSRDSRAIGPVPLTNVVGRALFH